MGHMGMHAAGAYLKALRNDAKLSQGKLAELVGVTGNTIWRIEAGEQEPKAPQLAALLTILKGRIEDFYELISSADATELDGQARAAQLLTQRDKDWLTNLADTDPKRVALLRRVYELSDDPELRARISGYLDGLEA